MSRKPTVTSLKREVSALNDQLAQLACNHAAAQHALAVATDLFQRCDPALSHYLTWWVGECQRNLAKAAQANSAESVRVIEDQIAELHARMAPLQAELKARAAERYVKARARCAAWMDKFERNAQGASK